MHVKCNALVDNLSQYLMERQEMLHGVMLAILSDSNVLLLGSPGTAKSLLTVSFQNSIEGTKNFERLLTKFTTPEEVIGPYSLKALEEDEYKRKLENYIGDADFAFLDEIFKSSSALLNSLLTILNERKIANGADITKIPLLTVVGASNEIPEESDGLSALFDRFQLKFVVRPIQEVSNKVKMLTSGNPKYKTFLTLNEIKKAKEEVEKVEFDDEMAQIYTTLMESLRREALQATDRTYKHSIKILKAEAFLHGRTKVEPLDFEVLQHVLWSEPEKAKEVYGLILREVHPLKEQVLKHYAAAEELVEELKNVKDKDANKQTSSAIEITKKLKELSGKIQVCAKSSKTAEQAADLLSYGEKVDSLLSYVFTSILGVKDKK